LLNATPAKAVLLCALRLAFSCDAGTFSLLGQERGLGDYCAKPLPGQVGGGLLGF
jgi:hypothetical protein